MTTYEESKHPEQRRLIDECDRIKDLIIKRIDPKDLELYRLILSYGNLCQNEGVYAGVEINNPELYKRIMDTKQADRIEKEQDECNCNHLSEEEMSRCLEYNNGRFECPDCGQLH